MVMFKRLVAFGVFWVTIHREFSRVVTSGILLRMLPTSHVTYSTCCKQCTHRRKNANDEDRRCSHDHQGGFPVLRNRRCSGVSVTEVVAA
ncbi:hypothetical protein BKA59DRAFT_463115 [Fusarium tricinctum]|uniref:Uncharacterized protein n=1 Tax=Fusarium tricinctum TaxID=61284 RepID=A0A8K0S6W1_9HYPO|nr:hypothetical protein BKA59DRAFT_463115 [Fusarium tricinctum]